jgi:hypothetical protein
MSKKLRIVFWLLFVTVIVVVIIYERRKVNRRIINGEIVEGIIIGKSKVAKGQRFVDYQFYVGKLLYKGSRDIEFCNGCDSLCCEIGARVKVRYDKDNPQNNELIH